MRNILKVLVLSLFFSCSSDNRSLTYPDTVGLTYGESEQNFDNTFSSLRVELDHAGFEMGVRSFDLKSYAESHRRRSRDAKMLFVSKPKQEIPIIEENPEVGIEFPSRMLTYVDKNKYVLIAYNSLEYIKQSYDLNNVSSTVRELETSMSEVVYRSTGAYPLSNENSFSGNKLQKQKSFNTFDQTFNSLRNMIMDHVEFKEIGIVDHQANAALINKRIKPNKVMIFTTGEMESDVIDRYQISSVDLPLRILVWVDKFGEVQVSWVDIDAFAIRNKKIDTKRIAKFNEIRIELKRMVDEATRPIKN